MQCQGLLTHGRGIILGGEIILFCFSGRCILILLIGAGHEATSIHIMAILAKCMCLARWLLAKYGLCHTILTFLHRRQPVQIIGWLTTGSCPNLPSPIKSTQLKLKTATVDLVFKDQDFLNGRGDPYGLMGPLNPL